MLGEEKLRVKLSLMRSVADLYLKSKGSESDISAACDIPISSIKRYLSSIGKEADNLSRLFPEMGTSEDILKYQRLINEQIEENKRINKWKKNIMTTSEFGTEIEVIKRLYLENKREIDEETRMYVSNLLIQGTSIRKIATATSLSLSTIHAIKSQKEGKRK